MRTFQCPIYHVAGNASRCHRHVVAMTLDILQVRRFSQTSLSHKDNKKEEPPHSQDSSPDQQPSPKQSAANLAAVTRPHDIRIPLASLEDYEPDFFRDAPRMFKALKWEVKLHSRMREILTNRAFTTKELESLKRTGKRSFAVTRQGIEKSALVTGPWTEEETEILKKMREEREHARIIAHRLARDEASVRVQIKHLSGYFQDSNKTPLYEGPQALPPELESSIFRSRLETVWEGLMTLRTTQEWAEVLSESQSESWLSMIEEYTPKHVKSILASHQPPNIAKLESIEWSPTNAAGVYGWVLKPTGSIHPFDDECYLWVGSASMYGGGLESRKENLLSWSRYTENEAPKFEMKNLGLSRRGKLLFTLLEVPFENDSAEEIQRIRRLVTLAREVFVIWLAAAKDCSKVKEAVPWELADIFYHCLAGHNLTRNIKGVRNEKTERRKR
ncbi:hypothetical protein ONS96_011692 [Cadophora gregata f. sp. sojae]|nr:hypothetical protein ONS96_011692 [Cadophora gregata f. sp. sojae]